MNTGLLEIFGEPVALPRCRHHWVIDRPAGPTSRGVCKVCGEEKYFSNSQSDMDWDFDPVKELSEPSWDEMKRSALEVEWDLEEG
ncbi:MAG: hypothetical protein HYU86_11610 [Chloroflexi bacterium]|nr:hypothetical protein [Chloroflexota bacterium]